MTMGKDSEEEKSTGGTATSTATTTATTTATETTTVASTSASSATVSNAGPMPSRTSTAVTASSVAQTSSATSTAAANSAEPLKVSMATVLENATSRACNSSYPALAAQPPTSTPAAPGSGSPEDLPERGVRGQGLPPEEGRQRAHPGRGEPRARASAEAKRVSRARSPQASATSPPRSPPATSSATATSATATSSASSLPPVCSYSPLAASTPIPVSLSPPLASSTPLLGALPSPFCLDGRPAFSVTSALPDPSKDFFSQKLKELRSGLSKIPPNKLARALALSLGCPLDESDPRVMEDADEFVKPIIKDGEVILEVECGQTKGLLYLSKLCQGSKGSCIFSEGNWFAPNEFQFHCGRESAKDWKRSIRHFGKSLKLLLSRNILVVHPTSCECPGCKTPTQMNRTRNGKERKPVGDKTRVKKQPSLDHHVNGAFKPVGFPSMLVSAPPPEAKPLPATEASPPKKQPERHCSPLRESTNTIEEPRSPKSSPSSDQEDRHVVTSDTENTANSPSKHEESKAEVKATAAAAPKSEKSPEGASLDQLRKQLSPPKAECARVKGDFRPKAQHEARGEKRKSSESAEERNRDAKVAAVSSASHPDTPQRKSSDHEGRRSASPSKPSPRDSEARGSGEEAKAKASKEREERRERERQWERASLASLEAQTARDTSPPSALPDSSAYSHILSHMARSNGVPHSFLSPTLIDAYALRSQQDLPVQHPMMNHYMPLAGISPTYQSLLASKEYAHSLSHTLPHTLPFSYSMNSMLASGSGPYDPRLTLAMSNYAFMDQYNRSFSSLPSSVGSYFPNNHHAAMLKRLHPEAPDALDLSTKAVRLDYGGAEYRYDPATLGAMYSALPHFDYKYAPLALPKSYPEDLARGSP